MASLSQLITKPPCPTKRTSLVSSSCPFLPAQARAPRCTRTQKRIPAISCSAKNQNNNHDSDSTLNRRDVLIGLGGLYGATAAVSTKQTARAEPVETPDITKCHEAKLPEGAIPTSCCPPKIEAGKTVKLFVPPGTDTPLKVRPAAHLAANDPVYVEKFTRALKLMRELPDNDPRSFKNQAMIHCAYCDGAYDMVGLPDVEVQVHNSWLFFPFHRAYLYFFERILGKLIDDPTFAMPFWNWDATEGMPVPTIYKNARSPMFDKFRDKNHMNKLVDLDYAEDLDENVSHEDTPNEQLIQNNLQTMYRQMRTNSSTPELFFGQAYRKGYPAEPGGGQLENVPHGSVHIWVGDKNQPNWEDMGSLYSAGRDPLFYAHHSNVDRMWNIWKTLGTRNVDICDPDYLNASFYFYDENKDLIRITVADCLDSERLMRYKYQEVPIEWLDKKSTTAAKTNKQTLEVPLKAKEAKFPLVLTQAVRATVKRPKINRSVIEKKAQEEILTISGIELNRDARVKFDVVLSHQHKVADPKDTKTEHREFLGSYVNVPRKHKHDQMDMKITTSIKLGLTEVIDDLDVNDDETIDVILLPVTGGEQVTISSISIDLSS